MVKRGRAGLNSGLGESLTRTPYTSIESEIEQLLSITPPAHGECALLGHQVAFAGHGRDIARQESLQVPNGPNTNLKPGVGRLV